MDGLVHHAVVSGFTREGHAPSVDEIAASLGRPRDEVAAALRRLHDGHGLVLQPGSLEVWIAHPFSASPTAVWVAAEDRGWWAPCMWCAMGVVALAAPRATIHARWAGEAGEARIEVDESGVHGDAVVHFAIPPRDAWSNVVHWCATVLPFRRAEEVAPWCERHRIPRGELVPLDRALALGRAWYGRHLERDWRKWSAREAQAIFDEVGLSGDFWRVPASDQPF
jgi:hypothetical protein